MLQQDTPSGTNDQSTLTQLDCPVPPSTTGSQGSSYPITPTFLRAIIPPNPASNEVTEIKLEVEEENGSQPTTFVWFPTYTKIAQLEHRVESLRRECQSIRKISQRIENNWNTALDIDLNEKFEELFSNNEDRRPSSLASTSSHQENSNADGVARTKHGFSTLDSSRGPATTTSSRVDNGFFTSASLPIADSVPGSPSLLTSSAWENFSAQSPSSSVGPPSLTGPYPYETFPEPMDLPNDKDFRSSCDPGQSSSSSTQGSSPKRSSLRTFRKGTRSSPRLKKMYDVFDEVTILSGAPTESTHAIDVSRGAGFYCSCGMELASRSGLLHHIRYFTQEWKFKCSECNVTFFSLCDLRYHNAKSHNKSDNFGDDAAGCTKCGMVFSSRLLLNRHHSRAHVSKSKSRASSRRG